MSIPPTELQDRMVAYYSTHVKVNTTSKAKIIQLETTQQSHDEVASHKWKRKDYIVQQHL